VSTVVYVALAASLVVTSGCVAASLTPALAPSPAPVRSNTELARFMREMVNVPFSFAMLEHDGRQRQVRYQRAAIVLRDAVRDLVHWHDPPGASAAASEVFFEYARDLERQVGRFEIAARHHDVAGTAQQLEAIRQTCNSCHRFFRPSSVISADVVYDRFAVDLGVTP